MDEQKAARNYKDSVFTSLFNDKERLLELYNAIKGTSYDDPNMIDINTLSDVLFLGQQNDISFTIGGKLVVLIEHQSTVNNNMPLRALMYVGRIYEGIIPPKKAHGTALVKIPRPEFIVLYNGKEEYPDEKILKLSDAFEVIGEPEDKTLLELEVRVLNINKGRNVWMSERSKSLSGYSEFIAKVRELESQKPKPDLGDAVRGAISYCMDADILLNYFREHGSEVVNMLFHEFKLEEALDVRFEEGIAIGEARGESKGIAIGEARGKSQGIAEDRAYIKSLQAQGFDAEYILEKFMQNPVS